jgi:crotonobetainyl-CoA:carnitine CoA-transferase CaiB-like acyl-CoA transferase
MLKSYRVLDLTDHGGEIGAVILEDLGAEVIKIEPPGGRIRFIKRVLPRVQKYLHRHV